MSYPIHQTPEEIARNLKYIEHLTHRLVDQQGERLVALYQDLHLHKIAEIVLPEDKVTTATSAIRRALKILMTPEELEQIAHRRWSENGRANAHTFTSEEIVRGHENRTYTMGQILHMIEERGDAVWTEDEDQKLIDMMRAGATLSTIAAAVSDVAQNVRTISACRTRWLATTLIEDDKRERITHQRLVDQARGFTNEERERGHHFSDADRTRALEANGVTAWRPEEDALLIQLRAQGMKFREIAANITQQSGVERTTASCISRFYNALALGTKNRRKRTSNNVTTL